MKYLKITQKPYCCVGACLEMILNRRNITNNGQIDIACQLGLIVPKEYKDDFPNAIISKKPKAGYGTQIQKDCFSINNFFEKNNIDLKEEYHFITDIDIAKKFLKDNKNNDILICCQCATLYDDPDTDWGHMLLFESSDNNNNVTVLDPSSEKNYETLQLDKILKAIAVHKKENGAGFYLIK